MPEFSDDEIAREAYRIWESEGRSLWSHASDHWVRAIDNLRRRAAGLETSPPTPAAVETATPSGEA
jgi:hypothetical protein